MNKNLFSLLIAFALTLTGCLAAAPGNSIELEQLQQQNQLLSEQLLAAQEQINTLSTQIADLENASEPLDPVEFSFEALAAKFSLSFKARILPH